MLPSVSPSSFSGTVVARRVLPDLVVERLDYRAGQVVSPHHHGFASVIFLAGGGCKMRNEARTPFQCAPGTAIVHPAGETHSYRYEGKCKAQMLALTMRQGSAARFSGSVDLDRPRVRHSAKLTYLVYQLKQQMADVLAPDLSVEGVTLELLGELSINRNGDRIRLPLDRVCELLQGRFKERFSLRQIANEVDLPAIRLVRQFRERFGITPSAYVRKLRMVSACERLAFSSVPIADLAQDLGFFDQSHFCHVFGKYVGVTPSAYRQAHRSASQARA